MILYLDTSSLVKLYVDEAHSGAVRRWADEAEILSTCRVAYPEMISALTRRFNRGDISKRDYKLLTGRLMTDWPDFAVMDFYELRAGRLAERHGLRGFDAVHLSSAMLLVEKSGPLEIGFMSFDEALNRAASSEGLKVL
ncbi:MAG: type II toxin-antitoxin system VapC family toxin [Deltaproteobacteria bacterium]|nr:type II toxin-antitoxin system VapC family toxin [Deltaproteobacteria bacterium]